MEQVKVEAVVDITAAEKLLTAFSKKSLAGPFHFDLSSCERVEVGAGYRLGNLLRRLATTGGVDVTLPANIQALDGHGPQFAFLTSSSLGFALARHASRIRTTSSVDLTQQLKAYYSDLSSAVIAGCIHITDLHLGSVNVEDEAGFALRLLELLRRLDPRVATLDRGLLSDVIGFSFEAAQNVVDHSAKKPLPINTPIFSYLALRYHATTTIPSEGLFAGYTKRFLRERENSKPSWLEILINDDGNGIPVRHSQNPDLCWNENLATEQAVLREALSHSSVKIKAGDSKVRGSISGEGFTRIKATFKKLSAFASIRTGRCLAIFDGLSPRRDEFLLEQQFSLPLGVMPGTAVQVIVPIVQTTPQQKLF